MERFRVSLRVLPVETMVDSLPRTRSGLSIDTGLILKNRFYLGFLLAISVLTNWLDIYFHCGPYCDAQRIQKIVFDWIFWGQDSCWETKNDHNSWKVDVRFRTRRIDVIGWSSFLSIMESYSQTHEIMSWIDFDWSTLSCYCAVAWCKGFCQLYSCGRSSRLSSFEPHAGNVRGEVRTSLRVLPAESMVHDLSRMWSHS